MYSQFLEKNFEKLNFNLDLTILFLSQWPSMEDCIESIQRGGVAKEERSIISRARSASSISNIRSSRRTECRPRSVRRILSTILSREKLVESSLAGGAERHKRFDLNFIPAIMDVDFARAGSIPLLGPPLCDQVRAILAFPAKMARKRSNFLSLSLSLFFILNIPSFRIIVQDYYRLNIFKWNIFPSLVLIRLKFGALIG